MVSLTDLPSHLKGVLVGALLLTGAIAVGAFAVSYTALLDLAATRGNVGLVWIWPLLIDAFLVVAELALVGMAMVGGSRILPGIFMVVMGAATIGFNLAHAGTGLLALAIGAVPPLVSLGSTFIIASLVKALAKAMGRPLNYTPPPQPMAGMLGPMQGTIYRPDMMPGGMQPGGYPYAMPPGAYGQLPAAQHVPEDRHSGQASIEASGNGDVSLTDEATKRRLVEQYLAKLDPEGLQATTTSEIKAKLAEVGVDVSERWIQPILQRAREEAKPKKWPGRKQRS